jgi:antitoxin component of MazEF toxin-antitoxin module
MVRATIRRIGNSLGVIIPSEEARRRGLGEGDSVELEVRKARTLAEVWGALRGRLGSVDELNDLVDEGEELA